MVVLKFHFKLSKTTEPLLMLKIFQILMFLIKIVYSYTKKSLKIIVKPKHSSLCTELKSYTFIWTNDIVVYIDIQN